MRKILTLALLVISSCTMEPKYKKPQVDLPLADGAKEKISKISWERFFQSEDLQRVVKMALENNRDLKVANLNVESVEAIYSVSRSALLPAISANASEIKQKAPTAFKGFTPKKQFRANLAFTNYEIDFFGRIRSLKHAAFEDVMSGRQARNLVQITVISQTVNAYAQFLVDRENLRLAQKNLDVLEEKTRLTEIRHKAGLDSQDTLINAATAAENARIACDNYSKFVEQDSNALMILTGKFDAESLPKVDSIDDIKIDESLLEFTPSTSLLSRPDVAEAEHKLKSANADIGAARAAFFPTISLSTTYGFSSRELNQTITPASRSWTITPQISLPIFNGGQNIARLKNANVLKQIEIINYEKAIHAAFREALDQFAQRETSTRQLKSSDLILKLREKSFKIATLKNEKGAASALNKVDAESIFLSAKQNRNNVKKEYLANLISLYKVLGGGNEIEQEEKY